MLEKLARFQQDQQNSVQATNSYLFHLLDTFKYIDSVTEETGLMIIPH